MKKVTSASPPLNPSVIVDARTGEIIPISEYNADLLKLMRYVQTQAQELYVTHSGELHANIEDYTGRPQPAEFARIKGVNSWYERPEGLTLAWSRVQKLVGYKLITTVASYAANPNPRKQPPSMGLDLVLGAVDKQMATISRDGDVLRLLIKVWDKEYLVEYSLPEYLQNRDVSKWSLPNFSVKEGQVTARFSHEEIPLTNPHKRVAGMDLGRIEPFVSVVLSGHARPAVTLKASGRLKSLNLKRERLLKERKSILAKIDRKNDLGLDVESLKEEAARKRNKITRLVTPIANSTAHELTEKLLKHEVGVLHVEDLRWAVGQKYGSKWAHGRILDKVEHTAARKGITVRRVNPRNTSQTCHKCGARVTHNSLKRLVTCTDCSLRVDRDWNAAINIAMRTNKTYPSSTKRLTGAACTGTSAVVPSTIRAKERTKQQL